MMMGGVIIPKITHEKWTAAVAGISPVTTWPGFPLLGLDHRAHGNHQHQQKNKSKEGQFHGSDD